MRTIPLLLLAALAAGCATTALDNRIACTAAGDRAFVVSQYGPVGISSQIAEADAAVICAEKVMLLPALVPQRGDGT